MNYFAYSNNLSRKIMAEKCPGNKPRFTVVLPNYKLIFAGYSRLHQGGTASIVPYKGQKVAGAVYEISDLEFKKLDNYEEYPLNYDHLKVTVWTDAGDPVEAITYIRKIQSPEAKPSPAYLNAIRQGYKDWQIE